MASERQQATAGFTLWGLAPEARAALKRFEKAVRRHEMRGALLGSDGIETQSLRDETIVELGNAKRALYKFLPQVRR